MTDAAAVAPDGLRQAIVDGLGLAQPPSRTLADGGAEAADESGLANLGGALCDTEPRL